MLCQTHIYESKLPLLICLENFTSLVLTDWPMLNTMYMYYKNMCLLQIVQISTQGYTNYLNSFTITLNIIESNVKKK